MTRIPVQLAAGGAASPGSAGGRYEFVVGAGLLTRLGTMVHAVAPHARAALAVDESIATTHGAVAAASLRHAGYDVVEIPVRATEEDKSLASVARVYERLLAGRLERRSPVVAMGGGIVGDLAGFAAATYLRGAPLVQVPTTLLAMVDASIGGKTGVNMPLPGGGLGKNLVGAFWQPELVVADHATLGTLPARELRCGLAECVKHGMVAEPSLVDFLEEHASDILALAGPQVHELVIRSATIKARIVEADPREQGVRALLNLGHTFGHAIESFARLRLLHGEAVSIGLCAAAACSVWMGRYREDQRTRVTTLLSRLGLPTVLPEPLPIAMAVEAMGHDKKVRDGRLRLVLPTGPGRAELVEDVPQEAIEAAWRSVGAGPNGPEVPE